MSTKRIDAILIDGLRVDPAYQPPISHTRAKKIAAKFDPNLLQAITVNFRDGVGYIIDGQHRVRAAQLWNAESIPAWVYHGMTQAEEAAMFQKLNTDRRAGLRSTALFQAMFTAGDEETVGIQNVLDEFGLYVGSTQHLNSISSVGSLLFVWRSAGGEVALRKTLALLGEAWPGDPLRYNTPAISAVALFLMKNPAATTTRLIAALQKTTPRRFFSDVRDYQAAVGLGVTYGGANGRLAMPGAAVLKRVYNLGLHRDSNNRLEEGNN